MDVICATLGRHRSFLTHNRTQLTTAGVDKRKIYDLVNIFSTLGLIQRVAKGHYQWLSAKALLEAVDAVPNYMNLDKELRTDKSLGAMAYCFIALLKQHVSLTLDEAAEMLSQFNDINFKSKIRRLYDICKILQVVGLLTQTPDGKRSALKYQGTQNLERELNKILTSERLDVFKDRHNTKLSQLKTDFFNSISKAIEASDIYKCDDVDVLRKRRTSSFDIAIVEEFLTNSNPVVLPKVSIQFAENRFL